MSERMFITFLVLTCWGMNETNADSLLQQKPKSQEARDKVQDLSEDKNLSTSLDDHAVESDFFEKGVLLNADGKTIRTQWFGHAAPALLDVDKDGDLDLLVGQYEDGFVDIYENTPSGGHPLYSHSGKLMAGGTVAMVETFCCVGFTPCIVDFDHDGFLDILSGSYPGELHIFRGKKDGSFTARENIKGADGETLKPGLATTAHAADLDNDGDYDLLSSLKRGGVAVCYNNGDRRKPSFGEWEKPSNQWRANSLRTHWTCRRRL